MKHEVTKKRPKPKPLVTVRLPRPLIERLDELAAQIFGTRSTAIRVTLERGLRNDQR